MKKVINNRAGLPAFLLEAGLWLFAGGCVTSSAVWAMQAGVSRHEAAVIEPVQEEREQTARSGEVIGRLNIAELGLSVPVLENYDAASLTRGVGHVPGTAVPGGLGNLVLAGHRDTFFRPLRRTHTGMLMEVTTKAGRWRYAVDRTEIVTPDRVDMLDVGERPEMTLITCYPFNFVGAAPQRFIVHAHLLSVDSMR